MEESWIICWVFFPSVIFQKLQIKVQFVIFFVQD